MEKRIEEFVKIAIAVKCNRGDNTDNQRWQSMISDMSNLELVAQDRMQEMLLACL
jgi:hypothetical protein